jgi:uncharacterized protein
MRAPLRAWYTAADIEALAARKARLVGDLKVGDLSRLADYLRSTRGWRDTGQAGSGDVRVEIAFGARQLGLSTLELSYEAKLSVICQRCLELYELDISNRVEFVVLTSESFLAAELANRDEPIVLEDDERLCPAELIEDELIISVPLAPKHEELDQCANAAVSRN